MPLNLLWIIVFLSILLPACGKQTPHPKAELKSYVVKLSTTHHTMHFTGVIQPLSEQALTTPMDALVKTLHFPYGHVIKKGQIVFTLNSAELQRHYNEALTGYLKAKDSFSIARSKFAGTDSLWKAGLISRNNYLNEKSSVTTARITLMQASHSLFELIDRTKTDQQQDDLSHLSFAEFNKVRMALTRNHHLIQIKSPHDGVLLYPPKSDDEASQGVARGTQIKAGQVLGLVGDLSGIRVEINVPEVDIGVIKPGMPATIRGVAFGKQTLTGALVSVNAQAYANGNGGLPSFTAVVEVHGLTKAQQSWVKVGMSSDIELAVDSMEKLMIPTAAIKPKAGKNLVKILVSNGKTITRSVTTGAVNANTVVIDSGLQVGDVVLYE